MFLVSKSKPEFGPYVKLCKGCYQEEEEEESNEDVVKDDIPLNWAIFFYLFNLEPLHSIAV